MFIQKMMWKGIHYIVIVKSSYILDEGGRRDPREETCGEERRFHTEPLPQPFL